MQAPLRVVKYRLLLTSIDNEGKEQTLELKGAEDAEATGFIDINVNQHKMLTPDMIEKVRAGETVDTVLTTIITVTQKSQFLGESRLVLP